MPPCGPSCSAFRAGEGVQLSGWDGLVSVKTENAFVPDGASGWEMGVQRRRLVCFGVARIDRLKLRRVSSVSGKSQLRYC
jgi:hypothetical protein